MYENAKPVLFSTPMVQLLPPKGIKSQTRRAMNPAQLARILVLQCVNCQQHGECGPEKVLKAVDGEGKCENFGRRLYCGTKTSALKRQRSDDKP